MLTFPAIHGDKQQNERDWVLNEFKTGKSPIMVATDVASRGIGMIDPPPPPICPQQLPSRISSGASLSTVYAFDIRNLARALSCLTVLYQKRILDCCVAFLCYTRDFVLRITANTEARSAFLDFLKLSPRLLP